MIIATTSTATSTSVAPVVTTTLILSASPATPTAGGVVSYAVYFNPPSIQPVTVELNCGAVVQEIETTSSQSALTVQTFQVDAFAIGVCTLQASNLDYDSNIIQLTVSQQLFIASSLIGWTGGQIVEVNVTSPNLLSDTIPFTISCSIKSSSYALTGSSLTPIPLSTSLNGVGCALSTQYSVPYYLNLQSTSVNIAMSEVIVQSVVSSINPALFINFVSGFNVATGAIVKAGVGPVNNRQSTEQPAQSRLSKRSNKLVSPNKRKTRQNK